MDDIFIKFAIRLEPQIWNYINCPTYDADSFKDFYLSLIKY